MEPHVSDSLKFTDEVFEWIDSVGEDRFDELVVSSRLGWISSGLTMGNDDWDCCCAVETGGGREEWGFPLDDNVSLRETLRRYFARAFWNQTWRTRLGKFVFSARFFKSLASEMNFFDHGNIQAMKISPGLWFKLKYDLIHRNWWCLKLVLTRFCLVWWWWWWGPLDKLLFVWWELFPSRSFPST